MQASTQFAHLEDAAVSVEACLDEVDRQLQQGSDLEAVQRLLLELDASHPNLAEVTVKVAQVASRMARQQHIPKAQKKELVLQAIEYAQKALEVDETHAEGHKWYGVSLCQLAELDYREQIRSAYVAKEHLEKAVLLAPKDPSCYYYLGMWYWEYASMRWHVRKLLSLFVDTPPDASYAQALHCFLKAETVQPRFYCRNAVMLGRCYLRIGHERQGLQWLHAVSVEHGCFSFKLLTRLVLSKFMMKMTKTQSILHA